MPPAKSNAVQISHELIAHEHTRAINDELEQKPFDRTLLDRFIAALPRAAMVCDIGSGLGRIARYLHDHGVHVCGIDSSAAMVGRAQQQNPGIEFRQSDLFTLDVPDETFTAITGFYAFANIARPDIVRVLCELRRVLKTGGRIFISFHIGDPEKRREEYWREEVSAYFYFFKTKEMKDYLKVAGFEMEAVVERDPYPDMEQQTRRGYIFARKPRPRVPPPPPLVQTELVF